MEATNHVETRRTAWSPSACAKPPFNKQQKLQNKSILRTEEVAKETGMEMICQEEQQRLRELKGSGELHEQLVQHVQEL